MCCQVRNPFKLSVWEFGCPHSDNNNIQIDPSSSRRRTCWYACIAKMVSGDPFCFCFFLLVPVIKNKQTWCRRPSNDNILVHIIYWRSGDRPTTASVLATLYYYYYYKPSLCNCVSGWYKYAGYTVNRDTI